MVLSEPEGLLKIATADLETAGVSSNPSEFREGAWDSGFSRRWKRRSKPGCCSSVETRRTP